MHWWRWVAVLAGGAALLVLVGTRHGVGVSPDGVSYLAAARHLADGNGVADFDGLPLQYWPPLLPLLLAPPEAVGVAAVRVVPVLNAALLALTVGLAAALLRRHLRSRLLALVGVAVVALSPALLRTADMVGSEPLFTALVLGFALVLERACTLDRLRLFAAAGLLASAAILTRYHGFALVVATVPAVLVATWPRGARHAVGRAAWVTGWALLAPAAWAVRNLAHDLPPFGRRLAGTVTVGRVVRDLLVGTGRLVLPEGIPDALTIAAGVGILAVAVVALVVALRHPDGRAMVPVTMLSVTGLVFTGVSRVVVANDANARILAPFLPLLAVSALWLGERATEWVEARVAARGSQSSRRRALRVAIVAGAGLWVAGFGTWCVAMAIDHGHAGRQYAASAWRDSAVVAAVERLPDRVAVYSNEPLAIAHATHRDRVVTYQPRRHTALFGNVWADADDLRRAACGGPTVLAWFGPDPPALGPVDPVADGAIVRVACERSGSGGRGPGGADAGSDV